MGRTVKLAVGTFVRIPLADGSFGYGRVLRFPDMAFYDYHTAEPTSDLEAIAARPVLFAQGVRLRGANRWANLGVRPLEGEVARPVVAFMQDAVDFRKCVIFDTAGMKRDVTPEERLLDTFMGRPNEDEIRSRVRLE